MVDQKRPIVEIVWKKTVAANLLHCPAPTLTHYNGKYWLFFNGPMPGDLKRRRVMFSDSADGKDWGEAKPLTDISEFTHTGGCFVHDDKLYALFHIGYVDELQKISSLQRRQPSYIPPYQPMLTWTKDGESWSQPEPCYEPGWVPWRSKEHNGAIYCSFYWPADMYSPDLARCALFKFTGDTRWTYVSTISQGRGANETELLFLGEKLIAVSRRGNRAYNSLLSMSWPPYRDWYREDLPLKANGPGMGFVGPQPILVARDPRRSPEIFEHPEASSVLTVYYWNREGFEKAFEMESAADLGYPVIQPMPDQANCSLMAYYVEDEVRVAKLRYSPLPGTKPLKFIPT